MRTNPLPVLLLAAAITLPGFCPSPLTAQAVWPRWTAYWENDSFQRPITGSDEAYTNGVRVSAARNPQNNWRWVDDLGRWWRGTRLVRDAYTDRSIVPTFSVTLGQNFFTPTVITDHRVDTLDRPYAGILYLGGRLDLTEKPQPVSDRVDFTLQHSAEVDVGVMGPEAFAREVQTGVHVLRMSRIPKGWHEQLGFDPLLQFNYMTRGRLGSSVIDLTPHLGAMLGNPQTVGYGGATLRIGKNLTGFPTLVIPMNVEPDSTTRPEFEFALVAGVEGRLFAHNALLAGGIIGTDTLGVPSGRWRRAVGDLRLGFSVRVTDVRVSYTWMRRTVELEGGPFGGGKHDYGSLALSYEPPLREVSDRRTSSALYRFVDDYVAPVFDDLFFEAGIGRGSSDIAGVGEQDGIGMHVALGRRLWNERAVIGVEFNGIGRDGPVPTAGADHTDEFLRSVLATARVRPFGVSLGPLPGTLHLRGGVGPGKGTYKLQVLAPGDGRVQTCPAGTAREKGGEGDRCFAAEKGLATMVGFGYALPIGSKVSMGADFSWNRIALDQGDHTFFTPAFSMRYHP